MSESENKKLSELRVVDLRAELEKRGLDRNGVKQVLLERLSKALTDEGLDPENHVFEITDKKRPSTRLSIESTEEEKTDKVDEKPEEKAPESESVPEKSEEPVEKMEPESQPAEAAEVKDSPVKEDTKEEKPATEAKEEDGHESPIRLTLEDDDETLHDVESETVTDKSNPKVAAKKSEDKKSNTSEATSQSEPKTPVQSAEKGAGSSGDSKDEEKESGDGSSSGEKDDAKLQKKVGGKSNPHVVWISNVAQNTRASELKAALSACGKVTGAKVVVNARYPGTCCFGYVTMSSVEDVENVIAKLNNTELNGQIIKINKFDHVRAEQMKQLKAATSPNKNQSEKRTTPSKDNQKKDDKGKHDKSGSDTERKKDGDTKENEESKKDDKNREPKAPSSRHSRDRTRGDSRNGARSGRSEDGRVRSVSGRSRDGDRRPVRSNSRGRHERDVLTFDKIREERERQRLREKERILREETRRRHEEAARQREVERRQRTEAHRLEREKEKLRMEREKIEREKAELVRMERERQRLEREKIALEKMELERTLMRLGEERRAAKRPAPPYRRDDTFDDRKRSAGDRHFEEPPPPPRFDPPPRPGTGPSGSGGKYEGRPYERDSRGEPRSEPRSEPRGRELPPSRPKDSRYVDRERERDRSPHFRPSVRDERDRRPIPDNKPDIPISSRDRYGEPSGPARFDRNNSSWTTSPQKPFNSALPPKPWAAKDPWRPESSISDRSNSGPAAGRANDNRDARNRELPGARVKDSRYVEREKDHRNPHSKPSLRDERDRRPIIDNKSPMAMASRDHRYGGSNESVPGRSDRNNSWTVPNQKPFPISGPNKTWRPNTSISERSYIGPYLEIENSNGTLPIPPYVEREEDLGMPVYEPAGRDASPRNSLNHNSELCREEHTTEMNFPPEPWMEQELEKILKESVLELCTPAEADSLRCPDASWSRIFENHRPWIVPEGTSDPQDSSCNLRRITSPFFDRLIPAVESSTNENGQDRITDLPMFTPEDTLYFKTSTLESESTIMEKAVQPPIVGSTLVMPIIPPQDHLPGVSNALESVYGNSNSDPLNDWFKWNMANNFHSISPFGLIMNNGTMVEHTGSTNSLLRQQIDSISLEEGERPSSSDSVIFIKEEIVESPVIEKNKSEASNVLRGHPGNLQPNKTPQN